MAAASTIGQGTVVRGNVRGDGPLVIDGRVEGDVSIDGDVTLGEHGAVKGNISGARLTVGGAVSGDLHGTEGVMLESSARVVGDLGGPSIGIAEGALVRGNVRTDGEPAAPTGRASSSRKAAPRFSGSAGQRRTAKAAPAKSAPAKSAPAKAGAVKAGAAKGARKRPPAPVVPALSKRTRGRKKKKKTR